MAGADASWQDEGKKEAPERQEERTEDKKDKDDKKEERRDSRGGGICDMLGAMTAIGQRRWWLGPRLHSPGLVLCLGASRILIRARTHTAAGDGKRDRSPARGSRAQALAASETPRGGEFFCAGRAGVSSRSRQAHATRHPPDL